MTDVMMEVEPFKGVPFITSSAAKRSEKQPLLLSVLDSTPAEEMEVAERMSPE